MHFIPDRIRVISCMMWVSDNYDKPYSHDKRGNTSHMQ